ncbi:MAG TPA: dienelactone hydrolase family protein [Acidimicrobiales bacterium]|nr:dienelactone hydrolase family protein [Acidimicrobiales bacterium]
MDVTVPAASGSIPAYLALPRSANPEPGVVLVHDVFGMTQDLRNQADWLASGGFVAVAPDLFHGRRRMACVRNARRDIVARQGRIFDEVEAVRNWLIGRHECAGTIGVIGFCMGGGLALTLAFGRGFAASSVNYGSAPKDVYDESFLAGSCPIVASYGAKDRSLRGAADRLERALSDAGVIHDVKEYPGAGHGFLNDHEGAHDPLPILFPLVGKFMAYGYHEPSAGDARRRIVTFFDAHLRSGRFPGVQEGGG